MAKSIYEILADLTTTTSVPGFGSEISHTIPSDLFPSDSEFENESDLLEWAEESGCLHACLQKGIQKFLIELRATFKGCKKDDIWSEGYGQKNVDEMEWKITERPNQGGTKKVREAVLEANKAIAQSMKTVGVDDAQIQEILSATCNDAEIQIIMDSLT